MGLVDAMIGLMPDTDTSLQDPLLLRRFGPATPSGGVADVLAEMDRHDVELALVSGIPINPIRYHAGPYTTGLGVDDQHFDATCGEIARVVESHPDRFRGVVYLDPSDCMTAVRRLERAASDYAVRIAHIIPSVVGLAPNHPTYFPVYAKCVELGVTLRVNIGMPGPSHRAQLQEPMLLDEVLLTFPELVLVGAHVGHPWIEQVIALLRKYEHFYLMTSGWAPRRVPEAIWDFANTTRGADKVMWASDYPLLSIARTTDEARQVPLKPEAKQRYLRDNALAVHRLAR